MSKPKRTLEQKARDMNRTRKALDEWLAKPGNGGKLFVGPLWKKWSEAHRAFHNAARRFK
jgi:hypothetical protein